MSGVRVLVGTRKGAFILTSDGKRDRWQIDIGWTTRESEGDERRVRTAAGCDDDELAA